MTMFERILRDRVLPVATLQQLEHAVGVATAMLSGGIEVIEITLRTPVAIQAIERITAETDLLVGAGTVLSGSDVSRVAQAGAAFIVTPGLDDEVLAAAADLGIPVLPGIATPTEALRALHAGLGHVKVFPARSLGGPEYLRQLSQPYPDLKFVPSGGVTLDTAQTYLDLPSVLAVSGSWMLPPAAIAAGDFAAVIASARQTVNQLGSGARS